MKSSYFCEQILTKHPDPINASMVDCEYRSEVEGPAPDTWYFRSDTCHSRSQDIRCKTDYESMAMLEREDSKGNIECLFLSDND